ncbi:hypothetical protein DFS34DRAFT_415436 [Phlyctochytrium arcticum]|nr:hypothetical protein DFS34DRAFT_415436 [Phlyctochytrium arcticum]
MSDEEYSDYDFEEGDLDDVFSILDGHSLESPTDTASFEDEDPKESKAKKQPITEQHRALLKEALNDADHQTSLILPEHHPKLRSTPALFDCPIFRWTPENFFDKSIVPCVHCDNCIPKRKDAHGRFADDHSYRVRILYYSYTCSTTQTRFNKVSTAFMKKITPGLANAFPYCLTLKAGLSRMLLVDIHHNIVGPNGLNPYLRTLKRARSERWSYLCGIFNARMETQFSTVEPSLRPTSRPLAEYLAQQDVYEGKGLLDCWLALTEGALDVAEATMSMSRAKKCISIDATYKYSSHIRVYDPATGKHNTPESMKGLHIVQNEIGQILHIAFIGSESHEHIGPTLDKVLANVDQEGWTPTGEKDLIGTFNMTRAESIFNQRIIR